MAPRRGGAAGAGAEVAVSGSGRNYFEPPPLKRMYPWLQDGSGNCDIIAGGVDDSGIFKGVYVSGVHMAALLRTFALSKVFMPVDTATPIASLGQSLQDGLPIIIVTRGCFGRDMDYGPGPVRNDIQKAVWQAARDMRAEMPQVLITCIDVPISLGSDMIDACLQPPLNEYRELMYQDGTWYTPQVTNAASLGRWMVENTRHPPLKKGSASAMFNRKKFDWTNVAQQYGNMFALSWKAVVEVRPPADVPRRQDLNFTPGVTRPPPKAINLAGPTAAEATFRKALVKARESGDAKDIASAVEAYLKRATPAELGGLEEASKACDEAGAPSLKVKIKLLIKDIDEALKLARGMKSAAGGDGKAEVEALKLELDCLYELGDLDEAVTVATAGKTSIVSKNEPEATCEAWKLLVAAQLRKGDAEAALTTATDAATSKDKKTQAAGFLLVAEATIAKDGPKGAAAVADTQKKALSLYKEIGLLKEAAGAAELAVTSLLMAESTAEAAALAKEMIQMPADGAEKAAGAKGSVLLAVAHLQSMALTGVYLEGGEGEMLSLVPEAMAIFEEAKDFTSRQMAQQVLEGALLVTQSPAGDSQSTASTVVAGFLRGGDVASLMISNAQAGMKTGKLCSAYWNAKQAAQAAQAGGNESKHEEAMAIMQEVAAESGQMGKPIVMGSAIPVYSASMTEEFVSFV